MDKIFEDLLAYFKLTSKAILVISYNLEQSLLKRGDPN